MSGWSGDSRALARGFAHFRRRIRRDPDVGADARTMVPVSFNPDTRQVRVWAFLGWTRRDAQFEFVHPPRVTAERLGSREPSGHRVAIVPSYRARSVFVEEPVIVEAVVSRRLDRDAFRRLCNRHRRLPDILAALEGL